MKQANTRPSRSHEPLVERLIALSGSQETEQALSQRQGCINQSLIRMLKDEVSYLIRVDIPRAVKLAAAIREAAAWTDDPICEALAAHAGAQAAHVSGRYAQASELYEQGEAIYARLGKEVEAARIARAKASPLIHLGQYEKALQVSAHACEIFQRHKESILLAQTQENMGCIYHRLDQYHEALKLFDRARETYAAHQFELGLASVSLNAANQYTALNEFERGLRLYQQAQQIYQKLDMPLLVNQTEYSIAWLYFQRGKFQQSLKLFARVSQRSRELGDKTQEALCDLDLAEVYLQLNAYQDALESALSAVEKFTALEMSYETVKARMYLGIAHTQLNDFATAGREFEAARRGFLAEGNQVFTALTSIYLSDVYMRQRDWEQVFQLCTEAKNTFHQQGLPAKAAYAELQLARLKSSLGEWDQAKSFSQSALQLIGETEAPWLKYQCLHLLGNVMEQAGQEPQAYQYYIQAIELLEALRSSIRVDEFKCAFVKDKLRVYEDVVELCLRAGIEEKNEEAFSHAEAAKSRSLVELLAADRSIASKTQEQSVKQLHREWNRLREELDWYNNRINQREGQTQQRPARVGSALQQEVRQREQQLAQLARRLKLEDSEYASLYIAPRPDPRQVRQCLAKDEVLIEYYIVDGRVKVFVMDRDAVSVLNHTTTVDATAPLIQWLRFNFDQFTLAQRYGRAHPRTVQSLTCQYLEKLYAALVEPIESCIEGKKLIVVPHDLLHYVPFHALYDGQQYLIDRHEISYCPSASAYKLCSDKALNQSAEGRVLIVGVPDEAAPLIGQEVAILESLWDDAQVLLGAEATLDQLKRSASECRLLHLASHGVFRRDNPMFSALKLGDTWMNLYDIFNLNLGADLVTLSACETGINEVFPGDELFGLMRGFLYAGAPSLIMSLWMVNDRSTTELMRWFYTGLGEGLSKRAALRQAQLKVKREYPYPFYWAPFILMGSP